MVKQLLPNWKTGDRTSQILEGKAKTGHGTCPVIILVCKKESCRERFPRAVYVHCSGHCLNLVTAHSCSLPVL